MLYLYRTIIKGGEMVLKIYLDNCCYNRPFMTRARSGFILKHRRNYISRLKSGKAPMSWSGHTF